MVIKYYKAVKRLFILFVLVHLVADLAVPWAGAFRFNPDESVVALRVQPVQAQEFASGPRAEPLSPVVDLPRLARQVLPDPHRSEGGQESIPFLPRRDPSADGSPQSPAEPA